MTSLRPLHQRRGVLLLIWRYRRGEGVPLLLKPASAAKPPGPNCHLLCASLAHHEDLTRAARRELEAGADRAARARQAWLGLARQLQDVTTDTRGYTSPAAAETADLAPWTGRLAYANTDWTLRTGPGQPARTATDLAPQRRDIPAVIAAIHHSTGD